MCVRVLTEEIANLFTSSGFAVVLAENPTDTTSNMNQVPGMSSLKNMKFFR
jgi:hypothetical protein